MNPKLRSCEDLLPWQEDARRCESDAVQDLMDAEGLTEEEALERYEEMCADGEAEREAMEDEREADARRDGSAVYW